MFLRNVDNQPPYYAGVPCCRHCADGNRRVATHSGRAAGGLPQQSVTRPGAYLVQVLPLIPLVWGVTYKSSKKTEAGYG
jgi:hypothetical protein